MTKETKSKGKREVRRAWSRSIAPSFNNGRLKAKWLDGEKIAKQG